MNVNLNHASKNIREFNTTKVYKFPGGIQTLQPKELQTVVVQDSSNGWISSESHNKDSYTPSTQPHSDRANSKRSNSHAPTSRIFSELQPAAEVHALLTNLKERYQLQKTANLPLKLAFDKEGPSDTHNKRLMTLSDRNSNHDVSSITHQATETHEDSVKAEEKEEIKPTGSITLDLKAVAQRKWASGMFQTKTHSQLREDIYKNHPSNQRVPRVSNSYYPMLFTRDKKEFGLAEHLKPDDSHGKTAHHQNLSLLQEKLKTTAESEPNEYTVIQSDGKIDTLMYGRTVQNFSEQKGQSANSRKTIYDRKKIEGIIKGIVERRSSSRTSQVHDGEPRNQNPEKTATNKKPSIFSNSKSLQATPRILGPPENNTGQRNSQERQTAKALTGTSKLRPPSPSSDQKPKTIFSNFTTRNSLRIFKRPSTPKSQSEVCRPFIKTLTERKRLPEVGSKKQEEEYDSPQKIYDLQCQNRMSPKFINLDTAAFDVNQEVEEQVYHCGNLENDEDSVISNIINRQHSPETRDNPDYIETAKSKGVVNDKFLLSQKSLDTKRTQLYYESNHESFDLKEQQLDHESGYDSSSTTPRNQSASGVIRQNSEDYKKLLKDELDLEDHAKKIAIVQQSPNFATRTQFNISFAENLEPESEIKAHQLAKPELEVHNTENNLGRPTPQFSLESNPEEKNKIKTIFNLRGLIDNSREPGIKTNLRKAFPNTIFSKNKRVQKQNESLPS